MPAWEAFEAKVGQLLPLPAQTLLFLESGNKACVRANSNRDSSTSLLDFEDLIATSSSAVAVALDLREPRTG
jgi:hypothetical protein